MIFIIVLALIFPTAPAPHPAEYYVETGVYLMLPYLIFFLPPSLIGACFALVVRTLIWKRRSKAFN